MVVILITYSQWKLIIFSVGKPVDIILFLPKSINLAFIFIKPLIIILVYLI